MRSHNNLHRRQRDIFSSPEAFASAVKDAFTDEDEEETKTQKATTTTAKAAATTAKATTAAPTTTQRTVMSVVYVTASATFDGPIGGYKTLGVDGEEEEASTTQKAQTTEAATTTKQQSIFVADVKTSTTNKQQTTLQTSSGLPASINSPTAALSSSIAVVAATGSASRTVTSAKKSATLASAAGSSATSSALPEASGGMTAGGKAGLAIGILLLIGAVLAIALFLFKKRKDKARKEEELENEKSAMFAAQTRAASAKSDANAPKLSLRPVTEFLPNLGAKRSSQGNVITTMANSTPNGQHTSSEQNRNNPFGNSAEVIDSNGASTQVNGLAPAGLTRGASKRVNGASPMDYTTKNNALMGPPSPAGTEFSQNSDANSTPTPSGSGAAIAAAGGPANTAVFRVQLDFKPSMEDELELRAGQLVRLLHEYDDGWVSISPCDFVSSLTFLGSLHPSRSLSTRCRSPYMSVNSPCQASSTTTARSTPISTRSAWSPRSNACQLSWYERWSTYERSSSWFSSKWSRFSSYFPKR